MDDREPINKSDPNQEPGMFDMEQSLKEAAIDERMGFVRKVYSILTV